MTVIAPAAVTRNAAPCSYRDCALRVERGYWSGPSLVRGATGQPVAHLDADLGAPRSSDILTVFAGNDSASMYG